MRMHFGLAVAAFAAFAAPAAAAPLSLEVLVRYRAGAHKNNAPLTDRTLPAAGVQVELYYSRNWLGVPRVFARAVTNEQGLARFSFTRRNRTLQVRIKTESRNCRVGRGIFLRTHARTIQYSTSALRGSRVRKVITFSDYARDMFTRAVSIQDYAHRTGAFARRVFGGVLPRYNRITYSFPKIFGSGSYAPFANRAVIADDAYSRSLETVTHETFHCFWYQARGVWFEYYWPIKHSPGKKAGNPSLAASEGWASAMGLEAIRDIARRKKLSAPRNLSNWGDGEDHPLHGIAPATWRSWGDDNEMNVVCSLIDLIDTTADRGMVDPRYLDLANGGDVPSGPAAIKLIYASIKKSRGKRPRFLTLWAVGLKERYGWKGASSCRANGIPAPSR